MLERATVCVKTGAARESQRCVRTAPRSKRMLHSSFWSHGAGDLDLPPWAASMLPMPSDLPLQHGDPTTEGSRKHMQAQHATSQERQGLPDGVFLDFLYPQQALAWLRRSNVQQSPKWEKRNAKRLPDGFVVASRGYASRSHGKSLLERKEDAQLKRMEEEAQEEAQEEIAGDDNGHVFQPFQDNEVETPPVSDQIFEARDLDDFHYTGTSTFADSPMELLEENPDNLQRLRSIMMDRRLQTLGKEATSSVTNRAWNLYKSLSEEARDEVRLKIGLLSWLKSCDTEDADRHCAELYHSIAIEERTIPVYETALAVFLRRNQHLLASKLHREALKNLENGERISRALFTHAIDNNLWRLAIRTEGRHSEISGAHNMRSFWLHVSETPRLLSRAFDLTHHLRPALKTGRIDTHTQKFCANFMTEAIMQEFLQPDEQLYTVPSVSKKQPPRSKIRRIFRMLAAVDEDTANTKIFEATLRSLVMGNARINYTETHHLVSWIYTMYKEMPGVLPSQELLFNLLHRVTFRADNLRDDRESPNSVSVNSVVQDWKHFFRRLSRAAYRRLLIYWARSGRVQIFNEVMQDLQDTYPAYEDHKDTFWTSIYLHARNVDLDGAQQAFAAVQRTMAEHGEAPDLQCWNSLLHAHSRVDDLEGALTTFQKMIDVAKLVPDAYAFHPLTEMFAKRGDVDSVEDLLGQYDRLTQAPRNTALLGSLITAFVRNDDVASAEHVLQDTAERVKAGEVRGSLTKCFNIILTAHGAARDMDATMRTYRMMQVEEVSMDANTCAALMFALVVRRQVGAASRILTSVMKEKNLHPTAFHYSIIMAGYNNIGRFGDALRARNQMTRRNIRPTSSFKAITLQSRAIRENQLNLRPFNSPTDKMDPLDETRRELQQFLETPEDWDVAGKIPQINTRSLGMDDVGLAAHFDFLIFVHGKRRCFDVVQELLAQYRSAAVERGVDQDAPPIRLLTALMSAYWRAGEHDEVEACWKLAKEQADVLAPSMPVPLLSRHEDAETETSPPAIDALKLGPTNDAVDFEPLAEHTESNTPTSEADDGLEPDQTAKNPRPSPGRQHILTRPLRYYLAALHAQSRHQDIIATVSSLLSQGYTLDNRTFNFFIECLLRTSPPLALLAFTLTERFLIGAFPGWTGVTRQHSIPPQDRAEGLQHIRARYLKPGVLMPQYRVMVRLGAGLLDVRRMEAMGRARRDMGGLEKYVGSVKEIRTLAPNTLFAVQSMPEKRDSLQSRLLRREV